MSLTMQRISARDIREAIRRGDIVRIVELLNLFARQKGEYLDLRPEDVFYAFANESVIRVVTRMGLIVTVRRAGEEYYLTVERGEE